MATIAKSVLGDVILNVDTQPWKNPDLTRPTPADEQATASMLNVVVKSDLETEVQVGTRKKLLDTLNDILQTWAKEVKATNAAVYVYGSVRLDVQLQDADTDLLCVATGGPDLRDNFFTSFPAILKQELKPAPAIHSVQQAIVPVIKMEWKKVHIDLAFANLPEHENPEDMVTDEFLANIDEKTCHSLAGVRNGEIVARSIPNMSVFWAATRAIKHWATQRGVYSNMHGFLGGGTVAIMVANICQRRPFYICSQVVTEWFQHYKAETDRLLASGNTIPDRPVVSVTPEAEENFVANQQEMLLIVNPAYPFTNNARNINGPQLRQLNSELSRGAEILSKHNQGNEATWMLFSAPFDFFGAYKHFLEVVVVGASNDVFRQWGGYVNSRIRALPGLIEEMCRGVEVSLNPKELTPPSKWLAKNRLNIGKATTTPPLEDDDDDAYPTAGVVYMGLKAGPTVTSVSLTPALEKFRYMIKDLKGGDGVRGPMIRLVSQGCLPSWVTGGQESPVLEASPPPSVSKGFFSLGAEEACFTPPAVPKSDTAPVFETVSSTGLAPELAAELGLAMMNNSNNNNNNNTERPRTATPPPDSTVDEAIRLTPSDFSSEDEQPSGQPEKKRRLL
eukprot:TRINITY_DN2331_c0_g1_i1.p1 TRINITY_DN2331_c0_g1~~TRINITY_DN2331_c0_g1_i1.p1  ORF type:complete len:619 (+),score=105.26 TRINITY_DN2331_c0_g1_i1:52-1908(+)